MHQRQGRLDKEFTSLESKLWRTEVVHKLGSRIQPRSSLQKGIPMKEFIVTAALIIYSMSLLAQDSTNVSHPIQPVVPSPVKGPILSTIPTEQELTDLFVSGEISSQEAVKRAAEKGDNAISGLRQLLFSELTFGSQRYPDDTGVSSAFKTYPVLALEAIGSPQATSALVEVANSQTNVEIQGIALNAIANTYYRTVRRDGLIPDKTIVVPLVEHADDSRYVGYYQKAISQIVQDGIIQWLGMDFGDPQFEGARKEGGKEISAAAYGRQWWQKNVTRLQWNPATGHFEIGK